MRNFAFGVCGAAVLALLSVHIGSDDPAAEAVRARSMEGMDQKCTTRGLGGEKQRGAAKKAGMSMPQGALTGSDEKNVGAEKIVVACTPDNLGDDREGGEVLEMDNDMSGWAKIPSLMEAAAFPEPLEGDETPAALRRIVVMAEGADPSPLLKIGACHSLGGSVILVLSEDDAALAAVPGVLSVERDEAVKPSDIPNDPMFADQWGLHNRGQAGGMPDMDAEAPEAWDLEKGSFKVTVAVIDSGVDRRHVDLAANLWINEIERDGIPGEDDDRNGIRDDLVGVDFHNRDLDPQDDSPVGHGTACAGVIGAVGQNRMGLSGICRQVRILPVKAMGASGGWSSNVISAMFYAVDSGADILSISLGSGTAMSAMASAITHAADKGVLVVTSAGNDGRNTDVAPQFPACFPHDNIVNVAAMTRRGDRATFSNYGAKSVDLAAPGQEIRVLQPGNRVGWMHGTSFSCPLVAGAAALYKSRFPQAAWQDMRAALKASTDPMPAFAKMTSFGGRLNAHRLMGIKPQPHKGLERVSDFDRVVIREGGDFSDIVLDDSRIVLMPLATSPFPSLRVLKRRSLHDWAVESVVARPQGSRDPGFGSSVVIRGHEMFVGDPGFHAMNPVLKRERKVGAVHVFARSGASSPWILKSSITPPAGMGLEFGTSVDVEGASMAVGAPGDGASGGVLIFQRDPKGTWVFSLRVLAQGAQRCGLKVDLDPSGRRLLGVGLGSVTEFAMVKAPMWALVRVHTSREGVHSSLFSGDQRLIPSSHKALGLPASRVSLLRVGSKGAWESRDLFGLKPRESIGFGDSMALSGSRLLVSSKGLYLSDRTPLADPLERRTVDWQGLVQVFEGAAETQPRPTRIFSPAADDPGSAFGEVMAVSPRMCVFSIRQRMGTLQVPTRELRVHWTGSP